MWTAKNNRRFTWRARGDILMRFRLFLPPGRMCPNGSSARVILPRLKLLRVEMMKRLVGKSPSVAAAGAPDARTPLHIAAIEDQVPAIRYLLQEGSIDINARDSDGYTALLYAAKECHAEAVDALCAAGADLTLEVETPRGRDARVLRPRQLQRARVRLFLREVAHHEDSASQRRGPERPRLGQQNGAP